MLEWKADVVDASDKLAEPINDAHTTSKTEFYSQNPGLTDFCLQFRRTSDSLYGEALSSA